jgi:hypothetical protein
MKQVVAIILLGSLPLLSAAQYQLGFKAGYDYYWFTNPDDGHYQATYDYNHSAPIVSLAFRTRGPGLVNFAAQMDYTFRSFTVNSSQGGLGGGTSFDYTFDLGNIYLQAQAQFTFGKKIRYYFYPGFYVGTLLHSSVAGTVHSWQMGYPPVNHTDTVSGPAGRYYTDSEFGICAGAGADFPIDRNLYLSGEINYSLNLWPIADAWGSEKVKMMNLCFQAGIFYQLESKKRKTTPQ